MPFMELFHVTPAVNVDSILRSGIDPSYATGRYKSSWYAAQPSLVWALSHISNKRRLAVSDMVIFRVVVEYEILTRTAWRYIYRCNKIVVPYTALVSLDDLLYSPDSAKGRL